MKTRTNTMIKAFVVSWILMLEACGGGGGGTTIVPVTSAEGLWNGNTSTSRTITSVILDNGTYWILPVPTTNAPNASFIQGTGSAINGSFSSSDGMDFDLAGPGISRAAVSASYTARLSLSGSVSYPTLNSAFTFTSSYNGDYEQSPNVA